MAIYPALSNINYPPKNLLALQLLITFSNMDPAADLSEVYFNNVVIVKETNSFNQQFESFGFETQNWIKNSGGFLVMSVAFIAWLVIRKIIL